MKILIIGGGYLSTVLSAYYSQHGHEVVILDFPDIDITNITSVKQAFENQKPNLVINAAAFTDTNAAELPENQGKVYAINVQGPANIAYISRQHATPWIQFSTAMMFDGEKAWSEQDTPNPTNYYSWTKAWADAQLEPYAEQDSIYILRIHTPLAALSHQRNFMNRLQKFDKAIDIPTSVTVVEDLCSIIDQLLAKQAPGGIYHAVNPGIISAYRIAQIMQKHGLIEHEKIVSPLSREELDAMTKDKGGAHQTFPILSTRKLAQLEITVPSAEDAVERTVTTFHE